MKKIILGAGLRHKLLKESRVSTGVTVTSAEFVTAMADIDYYRESAFRAVKDELKIMTSIFKEHRSLSNVDQSFEIYREGISDWFGVALDALIKFFEGMHMAMQRGMAFFISDEGIMKKYNALEDRMKVVFDKMANSSEHSEEGLAKVLQNSKIKWNKLTVKLPTEIDDPEVPMPMGKILSIALELISVETLLSYDINTKTFVKVPEGYANKLRDDFMPKVGSGPILSFGINAYEGSTIAKLTALASIFKNTVSGDLAGSENDATDNSKENLVKAKALTEQFIKVDNLQGDIFQAVARKYTNLSRTGHTSAKAIMDTSLLNLVNKAKPVTFAPKTAMALSKFIYNTISKPIVARDDDGKYDKTFYEDGGREQGQAIQALLASIKDSKKTNVFLELATMAKSWKKTFMTSRKSNRSEYRGKEVDKTEAAKNIDSITYVMKKYVSVMNNIVKTYSSTLIDTRVALNKVMADYTKYIEVIDKLIDQAEVPPTRATGDKFKDLSGIDAQAVNDALNGRNR